MASLFDSVREDGIPKIGFTDYTSAYRYFKKYLKQNYGNRYADNDVKVVAANIASQFGKPNERQFRAVNSLLQNVDPESPPPGFSDPDNPNAGFNRRTDTSGAGNLAPVPFGDFAFGPANLEYLYPNPYLIERAPYKYTDIPSFAKAFGSFNREQLIKNFNMSRDMSLETLNAELEGMYNFVPAASALKRRELSVDNIFNQMQRTSQVDMALPGVRQSLAAQTDRANTFASGRVPDEITDRGFELTSRSAAADSAQQGGFGTSSSVARKASDLMSADRRIQLSQYGDQLLGQNVQTRSQLELAPTSYSDAGQQVQVMPSISASQLMQDNQRLIAQATIVPATQALTTEIGQQQYMTNLEQRTREFNAGNINAFALGKFDYLANLAGAYAGAAQMDSNTRFQLQQQQMFRDFYERALSRGQNAQTWSDIIFGGLQLGGQVLDWWNRPSSDPYEDDFTFSSPDFDYFGPSGGSDGGFTGGSDAGPIFGVEDPGYGFGVDGPDYGQYSSVSLKTANSVAKSIGLSSKPREGYQEVGYDLNGNKMYSKASLLSNDDVKAGSERSLFMKDFLASMRVLDDEDADALDYIGAVSGDASNIASLTQSALNKDFKGFASTLAKLTKQPLSEYYSDDPKMQGKVKGGLTALQLFTSWDRLSGAQKGIALSHLGLDAYQATTGNNFSKYNIIPKSGNFTGINVGQALGLASQGYNVYELVSNWDDMNDINRVLGGSQSVLGMAQTASDLGLISFSGTTGAATGVGTGAATGVGTGTFTSSAGGNLFGMGPSVGGSPYTLGGGGSNLGTGGSLGGGGGGGASGAAETASTLGRIGGGITALAGAYTVTQTWGKGGAKNAIMGGLGAAGAVTGTMVATGMSTGLLAAGAAMGPIGWAVIAAAVIGSAIKKGKSKEQMARDSVRGAFKEVGLTNDRGEFELPDGTLTTLGIDGRGDMREWANKDLVAKGDNPNLKLHAYDIDYTNDLDFTSGMMGVSLSRIIGGGSATNVDQVGGNLGNAALKNIGYGKEMTEENFNKLTQNMRSIYSKIGIGSKGDFEALANTMLSEGRITNMEHASMMQSAAMMYDPNGYRTAKTLMQGRQAGVQYAKDNQGSYARDYREYRKTLGIGAVDRKGEGIRTGRPDLPYYGGDVNVWRDKRGFFSKDAVKKGRKGERTGRVSDDGTIKGRGSNVREMKDDINRQKWAREMEKREQNKPGPGGSFIDLVMSRQRSPGRDGMPLRGGYNP